LQGKVAALISWVDFRCPISFSLVSWCCMAKITTVRFNLLQLLDRTLLYLLQGAGTW